MTCLRLVLLGLMTWVLSCGLGLNFGAGFSFAGLASISEIGKDNLRLNWAAGQFVSGYVVYDVTSETPVELAQVDLSAVSYTVTGLEAGATYKFRVRAKGTNGVEDTNKVDLEATTRLTTDTGDLPAAGNIKLWIISDTGITKNADRVSKWDDQSGNDNFFSQSTINFRPIWQDGALNGAPAIYFDGQDDYMQSQFNFATEPMTLFLVLKPSVTTAAKCFFSDSVNSGIGFGIQINTGWLSLFRIPIGGGEVVSNLAVSANFQIITARSDGLAVDGSYAADLWRSGEHATSPLALPNITASSSVFLGKASGDPHFTGHIVEMLLYAVSLGDADRVQIEESLSSRYNLPYSP